MKVILVTVSDDRLGRKGGIYGATQVKIYDALKNSGLIDIFYMPTFNDILKTTFYENNKHLLNHIDPAKNGRAYKPYAISEALKKINYGDILIYQDCSPEMWLNMEYKGNLKNLSLLLEECNNILMPFVCWDTFNPARFERGIHTHENFTTNTCIREMGMEQYIRSYQCASGMFIVRKCKEVENIVDEWLYYNCKDRCCAMGPALDTSYSYWEEESKYKMGHRHDQSIIGLLMNVYQPFLLDTTEATLHPYNFLNFLRAKTWKFINSNFNPIPINDYKKGARVKNSAGIELNIFEVWPGEDEQEIYIVGLHRESAFKASKDELTIIT